jgi:phage baseplate assembly protein W
MVASDDGRSFLGTGWAFPPRFDRATGDVALVADEADIRESLVILMRTRPGERLMHPRYGCDIYRFVFARLDATTTADLKDAIAQAILFFEPRVILEEVLVRFDDALEGRLLVEIDYRVRATNNRANIVFPFYLDEGTLVPPDAAPR